MHFYQLSIGKLFKTRFAVKDNEFKSMMNRNSQVNVIEMNISFRTESGLQLISKK